jgi:plasmid maintenance system killer protein
MWTILEHHQADKELSSGRVPVEILKRYEKWKDIAMLSGPKGLRAIRGFRDEALAGDLKGFRSSRLNEQWRVIHFVEADVMTVQVIRVTPHDYRRH